MSKTARISFRNDRLGRRAGVTIKAGVAAILAIGLFASSPYTNEARAIDTTPNAVNASLVFSPLRVTRTGVLADDVRLCARNLNNTTVQALYVFESESAPGEIDSKSIAPGTTVCQGGSPGLLFPLNNNDATVFPYIVLQSPTECSQASDYPGKCRVVASFERDRFDFVAQKYVQRTHTEPVLLPGLPGNPRINPVPLPQ